jgi:hypothetical protein
MRWQDLRRSDNVDDRRDDDGDGMLPIGQLAACRT